MSNDNLINAKKAKNDEFYTQLSDIEKELSHYPIETFKDKVVYCPCDSTDYSNGYISNFAIYFYKNFKSLGLKKLICTCYSDGINYYEYNGINEFESHRGNGDFRSEYCTNLLADADIVVTNPPFSLFRDFVKWLVDADKKFIILGNQNAITYKEVFPLIKNNKLWIGSQKAIFRQTFFETIYPVDTESAKKEIVRKFSKEFLSEHNMTAVTGICWFTNIDINKRHENLIGLSIQDLLDKGVEFPKYDNYDAIEVSKVKEIPLDYDGVMGVPITFLYQYCPDQFEILGCSCKYSKIDEHIDGTPYNCLINCKACYARIFIRHRKDENDLSSDT